jgi:hypothetical protein
VFGGTRGPEITKSFVDIQGSFQRLVQGLRVLSYRILDVKARACTRSLKHLLWPFVGFSPPLLSLS